MLDGNELIGIKTLGSKYDNNCVECYDTNGNKYRIDVREILGLLSMGMFNEETKRKHTYLTVNWQETEEILKQENM